MDIKVADQRILLLKETLTPEEAKELAWKRKVDAFGAINKMASFLSKPKDEEFELTYSEHRYQPFWHVVANAHYVYDRNVDYQIATTSTEVKAVTVQDKKFEVTNSHIHVRVTEHCVQDESEEVIVEGLTDQANPQLKSYITAAATDVTGKLDESLSKGAIVVPPKTRISGLMRDALGKMIHGIQADQIFEENVKVSRVDLYYRPIYAFQYNWKTKSKDAIVEVDGVTGAVQAGSRTFQEYFGKVLDTDFLFDVGADAAGMVLPGGSIAVKMVKKFVDTKKK